MLTKKQLLERQKVLGASDIPVILGLSKYKTAYDLFLEKSGRVEPADLSDNEYVHFGNKLEHIIALEFQRRNKMKVITPKNRYYMKDYPYITALLDRVVIDKDILIEIKTTSQWNNKQWGSVDSDLVPEVYLTQVMTQMLVTGFKNAYLAVLIGGNTYKQYKIEYSEGLGNLILEKCIQFWNYVKTDTPPPPTNDNDLSKMFPESVPLATLEATEELKQLHKTLWQFKIAETAIKKEKEAVEFKIKELIKDNEIVKDNETGKQLFSWKSSTSKVFDSTKFKKEREDIYNEYLKERTSRRFTIKQGSIDDE